MRITLIPNPCCGLALGVKIINNNVELALCNWVSGNEYGNLCTDKPPEVSPEAIEIETSIDGWYGESGWMADPAREWWDVFTEI
jgi:hypothetical protein